MLSVSSEEASCLLLFAFNPSCYSSASFHFSQALLVLTDQKCSKVVEKILGLLTSFVSSPSSVKNDDSRDTERESRCVDAFVVLLRKIAGCAGRIFSSQTP